MLHVTLSGWLSPGMLVSKDGQVVTRIRFRWGVDGGEFVLDDQTYSIRLVEPGLSLYLLEARGRAIARAQGRTTLVQRYCVVEHAGRRYHLECQRGLRRAYIVREGVETVGYLERRGVLGRKAVASLPGSLALPAQVFVIAVVLRLWRNGHAMS